MIKDWGELGVDMRPLATVIQASNGWVFRTDRESDTTRVIREGSEWMPDLSEVFGACSELLPPGYQNRIVLSCVPAGKWILPHTDDFGEDVHRRSLHCHVPIVTDPRCLMGYGDSSLHMRAGHLYTMDVTVRHYVVNPSTVDRVHLLFAHFPHQEDPDG